MDCFNKIKNNNLKQALRLRRDRDYPQAQHFLKLACDEGCPEANFLIGNAFELGGWGIATNYQNCPKHYDVSVEKDYIWAIYLHPRINVYQRQELIADDPLLRMLILDTDELLENMDQILDMISKMIKKGDIVGAEAALQIVSRYKTYGGNNHYSQIVDFFASIGCASAQYETLGPIQHTMQEERVQHTKQKLRTKFSPANLELLMKIGKQKYGRAVRVLEGYYQSSEIFDLKSYAKLLLDNHQIGTVSIMSRIKEINSAHLRTGQLGADYFLELWQYGRMIENPNNPVLRYCRGIYCDTQKAVQKAIYCWMLIANRSGLYRDVSLVVAKMVWRVRDDPYLWGLR